jgi:SAM-dependent methyltransferase
VSVLARYYDSLARFQRIASWFGRGGATDTLAVHRLLVPDAPDVGPADVVHERILGAVRPRPRSRVLDAGCGLGGTIFYLHERIGGTYDGLTLSRAQRNRAAREASRRGIAGDCRFHLRSYDDALGDLVPNGVDLIVAIESLAHAPAPAATIANLARHLRADGALVIVDDVPDEALAADDPDFAAFRAGWQCEAIARHGGLVEALTAAGLRVEHDQDLTDRIRHRDVGERERLIGVNRRWRRLLGPTAAGALVDSLHGGLMLERLYRRGVMQYRLVVARRPASA